MVENCVFDLTSQETKRDSVGKIHTNHMILVALSVIEVRGFVKNRM